MMAPSLGDKGVGPYLAGPRSRGRGGPRRGTAWGAARSR